MLSSLSNRRNGWSKDAVPAPQRGRSLLDSGRSLHQLSQSTSKKAQELDRLLRESATRESYLQSRHIVDILEDFDGDLLPVSEFLSCLRPLQPRLYSISSSYLHSCTTLSITVARVKYRSHDRDRVGVASTYLTDRIQIGECIPIYISPNPDFRLPPSPTTPLLMIGPGTGLAPFRAFVLEKLATADDVGLNHLFFGCRRRDRDYLYGSTLEDWHQRGVIRLHTAFSREQEEKVYVQCRLWQEREAVWALLQANGHVYVCGDAQHMAPDVEACLVKIIQTEGSLMRSEAQAFLDNLSQNSRYQRDVWF